jgi:hypothetical protein
MEQKEKRKMASSFKWRDTKKKEEGSSKIIWRPHALLQRVALQKGVDSMGERAAYTYTNGPHEITFMPIV